MSSGFDHVMLVTDVIVNGSKPFRFVCALQISMSSCRCSYHALLELFQITVLLYESGLLLRIIQISVKDCIGVTLYDELFYHLHNRENSLVH